MKVNSLIQLIHSLFLKGFDYRYKNSFDKECKYTRLTQSFWSVLYLDFTQLFAGVSVVEELDLSSSPANKIDSSAL